MEKPEGIVSQFLNGLDIAKAESRADVLIMTGLTPLIKSFGYDSVMKALKLMKPTKKK